MKVANQIEKSNRNGHLQPLFPEDSRPYWSSRIRSFTLRASKRLFVRKPLQTSRPYGCTVATALCRFAAFRPPTRNTGLPTALLLRDDGGRVCLCSQQKSSNRWRRFCDVGRNDRYLSLVNYAGVTRHCRDQSECCSARGNCQVRLFDRGNTANFYNRWWHQIIAPAMAEKPQLPSMVGCALETRYAAPKPPYRCRRV